MIGSVPLYPIIGSVPSAMSNASISHCVGQVASSFPTFHGLVFSIIFNKQFVFVSTNPQNVTRAKNILEKLNLMDRLFYSYEDLVQSSVWENSIDYNKVNSYLVELRQQSIRFLKENI